MDRDDIGSWLSGPRTATDGAALGYPGERLGLPESGAGSVAGWGQRGAALLVDWLVAMGVTMAFVGPPTPEDNQFGVLVLGVFAIEYLLMLWTAGRTIGMALFGLTVAAVGSTRPQTLRVVLRTLLLVLVIPAVIFDRDRRGLHDKAGRTVLLRTR
jgi:uncharacterized RDD family membrane protein YckC